jgi:hypothetical protein
MSSAFAINEFDYLFGVALFQWIYYFFAIAVAISGIFAIPCCINIYKQGNCKKACTYCLVGSIFALPLGLIPGIRNNGTFSAHKLSLAIVSRSFFLSVLS